MRKAAFFLVGLVVVCLTACGKPTGGSSPATSAPEAAAPKPAELIIGKWEDEKKKQSLEFVKGGEILLLIAPDPVPVKGNYKFLEDDLIEVEFAIPGGDKKLTDKLKVKVDKDTLETTDEKKKVEKFKRVK